MTDSQLLREFVRGGSREALEELIRRNLGLVYSSALRQVRDPHLAEDVTQAVFMVLMQRAGSVRDGMALGGWLVSVTRYASVSAMRKQARRNRHEAAAARPEAVALTKEEWTAISPYLDAELNRLPTKDRDAVVLRFFQSRSFAEVGAEVGLTAEAARKRVERSVAKLRARLSQRGVSMSMAALTGGVAAFGVTTAPSHLQAAVLAASSAGNESTGAISIAKGVKLMMQIKRAQLVSAAVAATLVLGGAGVLLINPSLAQQAPPPQAADSSIGTVGSVSAPADAPAGQQPAIADADGVLKLSSKGKSAVTLDLATPKFLTQPPNAVLPPGLVAQMQQTKSAGQQPTADVRAWMKDSQDKRAQWEQDNHADAMLQFGGRVNGGMGRLYVPAQGAPANGGGVTTGTLVLPANGQPAPPAPGGGSRIIVGGLQLMTGMTMYRGGNAAIVPDDEWDHPQIDQLGLLIDAQAKDFAAKVQPANTNNNALPPPVALKQFLQFPEPLALPITVGFRTAEGAVGLMRITHLGPDAPGTTLEIKELGLATPMTPGGNGPG
ncbi:MAG: sigma-70 family RNA polymerase sigma factor [Tepidisphaeraceae bacterium]